MASLSTFLRARGVASSDSSGAHEAMPATSNVDPPSSLLPAGKRRKLTKQQEQFAKAVDSYDVDTVVAEFRAARVAKSTTETYKAALPLYTVSCAKAQVAEWPATKWSMEVFAAFLRKSGAYCNPAVYWFGILSANKDREHRLEYGKKETKEIIDALERGLPEQEQCEPVTVPLLRRLGEEVTTQTDFLTVLVLLCAMFSVARIDCFLSVAAEHIVDVSDTRTRLVLSGLKGEKRTQHVDPVFERLAVQTKGPLRDIETPLGVLPMCPVRALRLLRERLSEALVPYNKFLRQFDFLLEKAGITNKVPDRRRVLYSAHSTRVGAVCYLLKAGLSESVIAILANWISDQIKRYSRRVALDPEIVEFFPFYNPCSIAGAYSAQGPQFPTGSASGAKAKK